MPRLDFGDFLLNEQHSYLGQKVGDILTAVHDLRDEGKSMGTRDLTKFSERVVHQIRRILHSQWPREEQKYLKVLQKVGVAIMRSIEEKDDLIGTIASVADELERLTAKLGVPIHKLAAPDQPQMPDDDQMAEPEPDQGDAQIQEPPQQPVNMSAPQAAAPAGQQA